MTTTPLLPLRICSHSCVAACPPRRSLRPLGNSLSVRHDEALAALCRAGLLAPQGCLEVSGVALSTAA